MGRLAPGWYTEESKIPAPPSHHGPVPLSGSILLFHQTYSWQIPGLGTHKNAPKTPVMCTPCFSPQQHQQEQKTRNTNPTAQQQEAGPVSSMV